jgi:pyrroline-5-carboxylate reductase
MNIGFIGAGNMATAMVGGLKDCGYTLYAYDINPDSLKKLEGLGVRTLSDKADLTEVCDVIVLAVKPNVYEAVLTDLKGKTKPLYISIAAGITTTYVRSLLGDDARVVRVMPNTPAMVGAGMTAIAKTERNTAEELAVAEEIFQKLGQTAQLPESLMESVISLTGSSPAYVFMMIEAMADAAVRAGIPRNLAYPLAAQAVYGSAKMVLETEQHPAALKDAVCSPNGTTIEAVRVLEEKGFRSAVFECVKACTEKSASL